MHHKHSHTRTQALMVSVCDLCYLNGNHKLTLSNKTFQLQRADGPAHTHIHQSCSLARSLNQKPIERAKCWLNNEAHSRWILVYKMQKC